MKITAMFDFDIPDKNQAKKRPHAKHTQSTSVAAVRRFGGAVLGTPHGNKDTKGQ
jgi:hypothetical protein